LNGLVVIHERRITTACGGQKTTGASTKEIPIDVVDPESAMPVLTYTVKCSDPDSANDDVVLGTSDIIAIWVDTQDKGIPDRAPNTDDSQGCTEPETSEEVIVLELE
jgi:hypothetical protein